MVRLTFFLWEITQKFFFPSMEFPYPGNLKKQILSSWGVPMGPWGPFGSFLGKKCLFWDKFAKKSKFSSFLRLISHQYDFKTSKTFKEIKIMPILGQIRKKIKIF